MIDKRETLGEVFDHERLFAYDDTQRERDEQEAEKAHEEDEVRGSLKPQAV